MSESNTPIQKEEGTDNALEEAESALDFSELDGEGDFKNYRNKVIIRGRVTEELKYSHTMKEKKFYTLKVKVKNRSGKKESLPVTISDKFIEEWMVGNLQGKAVEVKGQLRLYNVTDQDGVRYPQTQILATSTIKIYETIEELEELGTRNIIYLDGYICMDPMFRKSQLGIKYSKVVAAIPNRGIRKDYITCMFWKDHAEIAKDWKPGTRVRIYGIIRNRKIFKKHFEGFAEVESIVVQDVSVIKIHGC